MVDFRSKLRANNPMPKEVLRSGASDDKKPAPAAPAAPAAASTAPDPIKEMETRLRGMGLEESLIQGALKAERKKRGIAEPGAAPVKTAVPAPKAEEKKPEPEPKPEPAKVEPKAEPAAKETVSDEEFARRQLAEGYQEGDDLPPEEPAPASTVAKTSGAAPDHEEDESPSNLPAVQNYWSAASGGAISGHIDRSDFKTPQLKIVQGAGPLSEKFNQGTLIFTEISVFPAPEPDKASPPINFIPVAIKKYYRENLEKGSKLQPRNAATPDEVHRLGGTTEFTVDGDGKRVKPSWAPAAQCLLIIERPENCDHPAFTMEIEIDGKSRAFAPATMYVNGGQYRAFVKPIMDATNFILCQGSGKDRMIVLEKRLWKMQVVKEKSGDNMVFNPKIALLPEATPPDLIEYAKSLRGS